MNRSLSVKNNIIVLVLCCVFNFSSWFHCQTEVYARDVTLKFLETITNSKLREQSAVVSGNRLFVYSWDEDTNNQAEIMILHMPNKRAAKKEANRLLLLIETGRTKDGLNVDISDSFIGEYSIRPRKITDDPHGFEMKDSDKTFIIFTRNNVLVVIDSKRNFEPNIDVLNIAKKMDSELLK